MADTAEILRLMRHAADRLEEEENTVAWAFAYIACNSPTSVARTAAGKGAASYAAASGYAQAVLRMVADFMTDGSGDNDG